MKVTSPLRLEKIISLYSDREVWSEGQTQITLNCGTRIYRTLDGSGIRIYGATLKTGRYAEFSTPAPAIDWSSKYPY